MVLTEKLKRSVTLTLAALLFLASLVPLLTRQKAEAYELLGPRFIKMSSSARGSIAAGQDVIYNVGFTVTDDAQDIGGVVVEFCSNSPIIGDSCTAPAGFDLDAANVLVTLNSGLTGFVKDTGNSTANKLVLNESAGAYNPGVAQAIEFDLGDGGANGVTNPTNVNTTFYARILTFTTATGADQYTATNIDNSGTNTVIDAGGVALSTAEQITVTAKVQENLTFCVYTFPVSAPPAQVDTPADPDTDNDCGSKSGADVILGDNNGVLSSAGPFVDKTAYFSITTNASSDAVVRLKGDTLKLTPACTDPECRIEAIGDTPTASTTGAEQFGMCLYHYDTDGSTTLAIANGGGTPTDNTTDYTGVNGGSDCEDTAQTAYVAAGTEGGDGGAAFAFDSAVTTSTYGQPIAIKQAGPFTTARMAFIGNISDVTEPGIYRTTLTFVATGTY